MADYPENATFSPISIKFGQDPMSKRSCVEIEYGVISLGPMMDESGKVLPVSQRARYQTNGKLIFPIEKLLEYGIKLEEEELDTIKRLQEITIELKTLCSKVITMERGMKFHKLESEEDDPDNVG